MRYYLLAGEASGDLHGANLVRALKREDPRAEFRGWGGDLMAEAGVEVVKHYRELAFMGFWEVVTNLRTILDNLARCKEDIAAYRPDALILIDYPGFNLRIAKWASRRRFRVIYYISPQLWAWHSSRVHDIKKHVDRMLVILPFERSFYADYGMEVDFVGHPLLDVVEAFSPDPDFRARHRLDERPIIALLPGSRKQEISRMLEVMLQVIGRFPDHQFVIAEAPSIPAKVYDTILDAAWSGQPQTVGRVRRATYDLLSVAQAALVTSGTATLEAALFGVPEVVCYRGSTLSYLIARRLVNVEYISLVNLIVNRPLVPELIQAGLTPEALAGALDQLLRSETRAGILAGYEELRQKLGAGGASERAARTIAEDLQDGPVKSASE